ncbi:TPA: hypothetical protein DF272_06165 [Candidatus Falkowbacteria bacterium]|nr:hypothetical protein [Candidatus Falkowbacteria bacterium]
MPPKIFIRRDSVWFIAFPSNSPATTAKSSLSADAAAGKLIREHPEIFSIEINFDSGHQPTNDYLANPMYSGDKFR